MGILLVKSDAEYLGIVLLFKERYQDIGNVPCYLSMKYMIDLI